jgi:histidyl-tRNA synthetase
MPRFQALPGTEDWLPERLALRRRVERAAAETFERAGYREVRVPTIEATELFVRTSGESSDVVTKEMYSFTDRGGRDVSLRPELTAGIVRAYIEHGMAMLPQPVRVYASGAAFRYNRAQRGRLREFVQFDVEAIGSADPAVDAELVALSLAWLQSLGIDGLVLELNSIDTPDARRAYVADLVDYMGRHAADLADDVLRLRDVNPLRAFDTKDARSREVLAGAPKITERLSPAAAEHFAAVRGFLDARGIAYEVVPTLVRGLDYYTHTAWEIRWPQLGAQDALLGGGRYDGFVEQLGGPPTPGIGFAAGIERIVLALADLGLAAGADAGVDAFVLITAPAARPRLHAALDAARALGVRCEADLGGRSAKGQFTQADRVGARLVASCGPEEWARGVVALRDRESGARDEVAIDDLPLTLARRAGRDDGSPG